MDHRHCFGKKGWRGQLFESGEQPYPLGMVLGRNDELKPDEQGLRRVAPGAGELFPEQVPGRQFLNGKRADEGL